MNRARRWSLLCLVLAAACRHEAPYAIADSDTPNPVKQVGALQRISFTTGGAWSPAWLPGDSALAFAWLVPGRSDHDRCIGIMPMGLLHINRLVCHGGPKSVDSMNIIASQAFSPGGRVAYVEAEGRIGAASSRHFVVVGNPDSAGSFTNVIDFPRVLGNGHTHNGATHLAWIGDDRLVYIGTSVVYLTPSTHGVDTLESSLDLMRVDFSGGVATVSIVPGVGAPDAISVDPTTNLLYALHNDSVFQVDPVTGQATAVLGLTSVRPVHDLAVAGGRVAAIVGGASGHYAGDLVFADLPGGSPTYVSPPNMAVSGYYFAHPAIAGSRDRIVAEAFAYQIVFPVPGTPLRDTIVNRASDLFLARVP